MARTDSQKPIPVPKDTQKDPHCVKNGCVSCLYYSCELSKFPCKDCGSGKTWLYWTDKKAGPVINPAPSGRGDYDG